MMTSELLKCKESRLWRMRPDEEQRGWGVGGAAACCHGVSLGSEEELVRHAGNVLI